MSNLMYREDHTTDCWINLLRLPIITIVTSSLYNNIFFYATRPGIKGRESKNLQCEGIWYIPMLRFRYFQVLLLPGFYSIVFSWCFYFYLKKVKIILTLGRTRGWMPPPSEVFLSFFLEAKTSAPGVFSSCSFIPCAHFESSSVMVSLCG